PDFPRVQAPLRRLTLRLIQPFVAAMLLVTLSLHGQLKNSDFGFADYLLAPVRVHLLSARDSAAIQTTLTAEDINRILGKLNGVWAQAGLHFYLESLVREEAVTANDPSEI